MTAAVPVVGLFAVAAYLMYIVIEMVDYVTEGGE
jgi:hypothetical protein